ncbi:MAG: S8 family serine peptidase [Wenzhouxiangellaceae bacterium]|nr:S8 family serine peptidase [Wenzhouxiangellaceae bacterium]
MQSPDTESRAGLPAGAIDYGRFLWMPEGGFSGAPGSGNARRYPNPFDMVIGDSVRDPLSDPPQTGVWYESAGTTGPDFRVVQFRGPIKVEWLTHLRRAGIEPVQYIHPFSYVVWADERSLSAGRSQPPVRWTGAFVPAMRARAPDLPGRAQLEGDASEHKQSAAVLHAMALVFEPALAQATAGIEKAGAGIVSRARLDHRFHLLELRLQPDHFLALARIPGVYTIQPISQDAGVRGEMSNQSIVGGYGETFDIVPGYADWLDAAGLDGAGINVGIVDSGLRESHQDLVDNRVACLGDRGSCASGDSDHGTHVAGAIGGTGVSGVIDAGGFLRGQGVAPAASLVEQFFEPFLSGSGPGGMKPDGMLAIFRDSATSGAQLTNNSWGSSETPQGYNIPTMQVDMIVRDADPETPGRQPVLPVWSVMNGSGDGFGDCSPSSLGAPDEAKNLFAVGSTWLQNSDGAQRPDIFSISSNSAHGPACDGRLVPHIVAPGCNTDSTVAGNDADYSSGFCGTSMAAPVVSGGVSLFMQKYAADTGAPPSPALVKAVFTAAATDLVGNLDADGNMLQHRPDRRQGWGRIDLDAVISPEDRLETVDQTKVFHATGESWTWTFTPEDPGVPMRIMLAWTDAPGPGTGGSNPAWTNDLDLVATVADGDYYGNSVNPGTGFSESAGAPDDKHDDKNNLEGVMLSPEQHSGQSVDIEVLAANLAADALDPWAPEPGVTRQDFALACINCVRERGFALATEDEQSAICTASGDASFDVAIDVRSIAGFADPVTLASSLPPPGFSVDSPSPDVIDPPGQSIATVSAEAGVESGVYNLTIAGSSESVGEQAVTFAAIVDDASPPAPPLQSPGAGATGTSLRPSFDWLAADQADSYLFELATDAGFSDVIVSEVVDGVSFRVPFELDSLSEYFWRVTPSNQCGAGGAAESSFTTGLAPGECGIGTRKVEYFADDMEAGENDWTHSAADAPDTWELQSFDANSPVAAWRARSVDEVSDQRLVSPEIRVPAGVSEPTLQFFTDFSLEPGGGCWDAGVLEYSDDDGRTWARFAGQDLLDNTYTGAIESGSGSPLAGQSGWCGVQEWTRTVVDLSGLEDKALRFRFRLGTDQSVAQGDWLVDDVIVQSCEPEFIFADGFED